MTACDSRKPGGRAQIGHQDRFWRRLGHGAGVQTGRLAGFRRADGPARRSSCGVGCQRDRHHRAADARAEQVVEPTVTAVARLTDHQHPSTDRRPAEDVHEAATLLGDADGYVGRSVTQHAQHPRRLDVGPVPRCRLEAGVRVLGLVVDMQHVHPTAEPLGLGHRPAQRGGGDRRAAEADDDLVPLCVRHATITPVLRVGHQGPWTRDRACRRADSARFRPADGPTRRVWGVMCDDQGVEEIEVGAIPVERLVQLIDSRRADRLRASADRARVLLAGRTVWNVNATSTGGGVAEMLQSLLAYARGAGVDTRWLTLDATPDFFGLTKRLHNRLHGTAGDGGPVDEGQRATYETALEPNLEQLRTAVAPGDIVLLHDPQTAGLAGGLRRHGARVVWRSHVGRDTTNEHTDAAWSFLRPYVEQAHAVIFSRRAYAPDWVDAGSLWVIPPSLDPFSPKNGDLTEEDVAAALRCAGLVDLPDGNGSLSFARRDGSTGTVRRHDGLLNGGSPLPPDARIVLQVSRWDRLKDMAGVLRAFSQLTTPPETHLMLVGPDTSSVHDDPEGAAVLEDCRSIWRAQPLGTRRRLHLCSLPMDDVDENAHLVNALQRHAAVVVQKSLEEGFGLTVTEPMWKAKAVVASKVGGIQDQIVDGDSGLLLDDPTDLDAFGSLVVSVLDSPALAERLGVGARERVRQEYLGDRHLVQYVDLFELLLSTDHR